MMDMPVFDENYAIVFDEPYPAPFEVRDVMLLKEVADRFAPSTHLLMAQVNGKTVVIPTLSMVYHKVAQGTIEGNPFMMTFCVLCNDGGVFSPEVEDSRLEFGCYGFHQGMALLSDTESYSRWNHITGHCLHGEKKGHVLTRIGSIMHTTVGDVLEAHPDAVITFPILTDEASELSNRWNDNYRGKSPEWTEGLIGTLFQEDQRLPRFNMGVGIWTGSTARYYPVLTLNSNNNVIVDSIDGQNVVVYYDEDTGFPSAFHTDATSAEMTRHGIRLSNGSVYNNGVLRDGNDKTIPARPHFQVIRWYGFSYLFPACEIYGV